MQDFEKLGVFYLGREVDPESKAGTERLLLYDSKDLVTHAVCVGMTGSGKTGLCIGLIEEAAIDGVPAIVVDPKGDLGNLLLTFPDLAAEDFLPWVDEDAARRKGQSLREHAEGQASLWREGLARWGQDGRRIRRLREAADFAVYTPGSTAGLPVSILASFAAPGGAVLEDAELLAERIDATATGLLGLLGIAADPLQSREHILLATILGTAWRGGQDLDLPSLIRAIQSPPVDRVGAFDLESFFPAKERFALAMRVNNLLAAPGFAAWLEGEPLDIDRMLHTAEGKPRVSILSIAHLGDAERMFFVSLLLTQLLGWMRAQAGTPSLRAIFYMDEIFGFFPPVANPPSKAPLLTLLKQARAFGLGVVLATQNPVDLDYKGLSNAGTWFIGRLQTDRDKERVLDGLEGASAGAGGRLDRRTMDRILSGLGARIFLMNNVHEDAPVVFETRWALSYLRGPLTREQIRRLTEGRRPPAPSPAAGPAAPPSVPARERRDAVPAEAARTALPPGIPEYFLPIGSDAPPGAVLHYEPMLYGAGKLYYAGAQDGAAAGKAVAFLVPFSDRPPHVAWEEARETGTTESDLETFPFEGERTFGEPPREACRPKRYPAWSAAFRDWLHRSQTLTLWKSPSLGVTSEPGESERDFRIRLQVVARERRDALVEGLRQRYAPRIAALEERIRRAEQAVDREKEQAGQQKIQTAISFGAAVLAALTGRKTVSRSSLGRAATTARGAGRILKETRDVARAAESVEALKGQQADLEAQLAAETERLHSGSDPLSEALETHAVRPRKADVAVSVLALAWCPYWRDAKGGITPAFR